MELQYIASYLILGGFAGLMAGMLGIGGGVIIVPALIILFGWQQLPEQIIPILAIATSLASIIVTSLSAMRAQSKRNAIDWQLFRQWSVLVILGGICSGFIASYLSARSLHQVISIFFLIISIIMLSRWTPKAHRELPGPIGRTLLGFGSGLLSGLAGIGGGNVIVPLLVFHNMVMQRAVATASALGLPIAIFGTIGYVIAGWNQPNIPFASIGYVYLPAMISIAIMTFITAPIGVYFSHKLPAKKLKQLFGVLLMIVAIQMILTSF